MTYNVSNETLTLYALSQYRYILNKAQSELAVHRSRPTASDRAVLAVIRQCAHIRLSTSTLLHHRYVYCFCRHSTSRSPPSPSRHHHNLTMYHAAVALTTRNWRQRCFHSNRQRRQGRRRISNAVKKLDSERREKEGGRTAYDGS